MAPKVFILFKPPFNFTLLFFSGSFQQPPYYTHHGDTHTELMCPPQNLKHYSCYILRVITSTAKHSATVYTTTAKLIYTHTVGNILDGI